MRELFERLRSFLIWLVALPVFLIACALIWLGSFVLRGRALEGLIKAGCRTVLVVCGVRVRVRGRENVHPRAAVRRHDEPRQFLRSARLSGRLPRRDPRRRGGEPLPLAGLRRRHPPHRHVPHRPQEHPAGGREPATGGGLDAGAARLLVRHPARGNAHARREAGRVQARRLPHGRRDGPGHPARRPERRLCRSAAREA